MIPAVEKKANELLRAARVTKPPVPVEALAKQQGARIRYRAFDGEVSGVLIRDNEQRIIGVHSEQPRVRQRFTIAHELGHLALHTGGPVVVEHLWRGARVNWRDGASRGANDREEIQANQFAAALLMPRDWLEDDYWDLLDRCASYDELLAALARRYDVSTQAMRFRLLNLALHDPS
jgi:Zn-dependent peptidase ImmA (M78 family)